MMKKIALGLSGGVDSAVSAKLLLDQGYQVTGVYLECYREVGCRADTDRQDALEVALDLGIPFISLDLREIYKEKVLTYFYQSYQEGRTPNPDLLCNLEVKFGPFYDWALKNGFEAVATGHYARIKDKKLYTAKDKFKDQTYFLALVDQEKWRRVIFPIGELEKSQVRALAHQYELKIADKSDSTGVCFVGEVGLRDFLGLQLQATKGKVMKKNLEGKLEEIGEHQGVVFYTIGQRHGFTITKMTNKTPQYFVIDKKVKENLLIVGEKKECYRQKILVKNLTTDLAGKEKIWVRLRHQGEILLSKISPTINQEIWQLTLTKPVFGISPGQFAVFYEKDGEQEENYYCLGAAEIVEAT